MTGIIIFSQSLQNDAKDDLWYNNRYYQGIPATVSWAELSAPLQKGRRCKRVKRDKATGSSYELYWYGLSTFFYFNVPSEDKDREGRTSWIEIVCPKGDKGKLKDVLEEFLNKSNRHLSNQVKGVITEGLKIGLLKSNMGGR